MNHDEYIRYSITLFSGFLQDCGSPGSGMVGLQRDVELLTAHRTDVRVGLFPWKANESAVAESLWRYRPLENGVSPKQEHITIGYSYGGDRAVKFTRELERRGGCTVRRLLLCDAVRRWDCLPGVAGGLGLGRLIVPPVVDKCEYYVQQNWRWWFRKEPFQPAGHKVVARDKTKTEIVGPIVRPESHSYMDNDSQFRNLVLSEVDAMLNDAMDADMKRLKAEEARENAAEN